MRNLKLGILFAALALAPAGAQTNGIAGFQQRASVPIIIYDTFDHPDGTLIDGQPTADGHSVWDEGQHHAVTQNGELTNTGNSYSGFPYTATPGGTPQPIPTFGGTFRYNIDPGVAPATVLIADKDGTMSHFLHLELALYSWTLSVADSPSYPFPTVISSDTYARPLAVGQLYRASMDVDPVGCKMTIHLPDGAVKTFTHPAVCSVNPKWARYQLGAFTPAGTAVWTSVWAGQSKAETFAAAGGAASAADLSSLLSTFNVISNRKLVGPSGTFPIAAFTPGSAQFDNTLTVRMRTGVDSWLLPGVAMDDRDVRVHVVSTGCCSALGSIDVLNANPQSGSGINLSGSVSASISGGVVTLYYSPSCTGPNSAYCYNVRLNYSVQAEGDPGGRLVPQ